MIRVLLAYLTFPGIIVHEFAHAWACRRLGVRIEKICYFRFGNPQGYVLHERPSSTLGHAMIAVAPFFVSTLLALLFSLVACLLVKTEFYPEIRDATALISIWCSFSMALHAFPSRGDADALWADVKNPAIGMFAKIPLLPAIGFIRLIQMGTGIWLDVIFALTIVGLPPVTLLTGSGA